MCVSDTVGGLVREGVMVRIPFQIEAWQKRHLAGVVEQAARWDINFLRRWNVLAIVQCLLVPIKELGQA